MNSWCATADGSGSISAGAPGVGTCGVSARCSTSTPRTVVASLRTRCDRSPISAARSRSRLGLRVSRRAGVPSASSTVSVRSASTAGSARPECRAIRSRLRQAQRLRACVPRHPARRRVPGRRGQAARAGRAAPMLPRSGASAPGSAPVAGSNRGPVRRARRPTRSAARSEVKGLLDPAEPLQRLDLEVRQKDSAVVPAPLLQKLERVRDLSALQQRLCRGRHRCRHCPSSASARTSGSSRRPFTCPVRYSCDSAGNSSITAASSSATDGSHRPVQLRPGLLEHQPVVQLLPAGDTIRRPRLRCELLVVAHRRLVDRPGHSWPRPRDCRQHECAHVRTVHERSVAVHRRLAQGRLVLQRPEDCRCVVLARSGRCRTT